MLRIQFANYPAHARVVGFCCVINLHNRYVVIGNHMQLILLFRDDYNVALLEPYDTKEFFFEGELATIEEELATSLAELAER